MNRNGKLYVISAPSGTGKTTVVRELLSKCPDLVESISYTTREPRSGERDGVDYCFVDKAEFERLVSENFFAEWAEVHGSYYGTPVEFIEKAVAGGKDVVLDVDVQGGMNLKKRFPDAVSIFLLPPSEEELIRRLRGRGTEAEEQIAKRLENAEHEMGYRDKYDHRVINDNVEQAVNKIEELIYG